jgi:hypothetical protein
MNMTAIFMNTKYYECLGSALALGKLTYSHLPSVFGGYNCRPIDLLTNWLILELAKLPEKECPSFDAEDIISDINSKIQYVGGVFIHICHDPTSCY